MSQHTAPWKRLRQYVNQRKGMRGLDPDLIHGLHTGTNQAAELRLSDLEVLLASTESETASREAVIEEIAKHIEDAPLTYMGPDPGGIKDLKFLIVAAIRDMKGKP